MTVTELQSIARVLSNSGWCRYWVNWSGTVNPIMAIQCRDENGKPSSIHGATERGFTENADWVYTIPRTNEDGTPYESFFCI